MNKKRLTEEQQTEIITLIQQNKLRLIAYIRSQFNDISDTDIEDCFQDLFVRTHDKFSSYNRSLNKTGWLFKAMKNVTHEFCRKKKKITDHTIPLSVVPESDEEYSEENDMIFEIITNHLSENQIVQIILSKLNEKEQILYRLRYIDNLNTYEIAERLSLPSGTVRARLSDIKKKITKMIREDEWIDIIQKEIFSKKIEHSDQN